MGDLAEIDVLDEQAADQAVAATLEENVKDDIEKGLFSGESDNGDSNRGQGRPKRYLVRHETNTSQPLSQERNRELLENHIRHALPFKGVYGTVINDRKLMIPSDYHGLLEYGGVVTYGNDEHLLLFGKTHWARMEQLLLRDLGMVADRDRLVRHFYRGKMEFDHLNNDGSITLSHALMKYAGLKKEAVLIGVVYFAEIHSKDNWYDSDNKLSGRDMARLSNALK